MGATYSTVRSSAKSEPENGVGRLFAVPAVKPAALPVVANVEWIDRPKREDDGSNANRVTAIYALMAMQPGFEVSEANGKDRH